MSRCCWHKLDSPISLFCNDDGFDNGESDDDDDDGDSGDGCDGGKVFIKLLKGEEVELDLDLDLL